MRSTRNFAFKPFLFLMVISIMVFSNFETVLAASSQITNGGFETGDFTGWTQKHYTGTSTVQSDDIWNGKFAAKLSVIRTSDRIQRYQEVSVPTNQRWVFTFAMKDDGGSLAEAGVCLYYYAGSSYVGRTFWVCTNEYGLSDTDTQKIIDISEKTHNKWQYFEYLIDSDNTDVVPSNVRNVWTTIDKIVIRLHVYGVSGMGDGITVYYDAISLLTKQFTIIDANY
ncbi:MAG: hypothetical protein ACFFAJ_01790 [Candidatus Hodarchaeota archaeon]